MGRKVISHSTDAAPNSPAAPLKVHAVAFVEVLFMVCECSSCNGEVGGQRFFNTRTGFKFEIWKDKQMKRRFINESRVLMLASHSAR